MDLIIPQPRLVSVCVCVGDDLTSIKYVPKTKIDVLSLTPL